MAFRAAARTMLNRMGETRSIATSTVPKMKPFAPAVDSVHPQNVKATRGFKADQFPIYMILGMIAVALSFGVHTGKQQLRYGPSVHVSKKKREMLVEVEEPGKAVEEADKFVNKSFFRKVAHIQDTDMAHTMRDPAKGSVFSSGREPETLKSVGVNPRSY